jgi:hypothetical protein
VRYVQGASAEGLVIRDIQGVATVLEDFTVFDISAWARGVDNAVCRDRELGQGWQDPEVQACIAARSAGTAEADARQQDCLSACADGRSDEAADGSCEIGCFGDPNTSGNVGNQCLYAWANARTEETDAACGPQPDWAESDFRSSPMMAEGASLTLTLGEGDVRQALTHGGFIFLF